MEIVPNLLVTPMFAENVSWVVDTIQMIHGDDLGCNGLTYMMERKGIMTLVELGVGNGRTVNHGLVVTENIAP
jgi:hypothetical protein